MAQETEATIIPELEKRIERLDLEFRHLLRKAESAEVEVRERVQASRKDFEQKRAALSERIDEAREAGAAARDEVSSGLESAWNELSDALNAAHSELMALK